MSPPPSAGESTRPFVVLVVGHTDRGRAPTVARLLLEAWAGHGIEVSSAGTHAASGEDAGQGPRVHDDILQEADLVLTTTRAERSEVVQRMPSALRHAFTVKEFARAARAIDETEVPRGTAHERLAALIELAPMHRGREDDWSAADDDLGPQEPGVHEAVGDIVAAVLPGFVAPQVSEPEPDPETPESPAVPPDSRRRGRRIALVAVSTLGVLVVVLVVGVLLVLQRLDRSIQRFDDPFEALPTRAAVVVPDDAPTGGVQPVTFLVLGSTDEVSTDGTADWAAAADVTDAVLLLHVTADRRAAQVVALPPDLRVDLPGGQTTVRAAFAAGGPAGAVQAVESLTQVHLDHVALTDRATFARVTESLGGVRVDLPAAVVVDGRQVLPAGEQRLTGQQALEWVQGDDEQDPQRLEREQQWLRAILDRLGDSDVRTDPATWVDLVGVVAGSVAVDEGLDRSTLVSLVSSMRSLSPSDVALVAAPTVADPDDPGTVVPDEVPFAALMAALRTDTLAGSQAAAAASGD